MTTYLLNTVFVITMLLLPTIASAENATPFWPTRDVTVTSAMTNPTQQGPKTITTTMMYQSAQQRMRINTDIVVAGQPVGYNIIDYKTHKAITVMPATRMVMETANKKMSIQDTMSDPNVQKEKVGTSTIAGLSCNIWQITTKETTGKGCVTDDGVVLSYEGNMPAGKKSKAQTISMTATSVKYETLPDSLFTPPEGYQAFSPGDQMKMNMLKNMMKNLNNAKQ